MAVEFSSHTDEDVLASLIIGKDSVLQIPIDIVQTPESFIITAQVPGVSDEALAISVSGEAGIVVIEGERSPNFNYDDFGDVITKENDWGMVYRRVILPTSVVDDSVAAELSDGVLTLQLQKDYTNTTQNWSYDEEFNN